MSRKDNWFLQINFEAKTSVEKKLLKEFLVSYPGLFDIILAGQLKPTRAK